MKTLFSLMLFLTMAAAADAGVVTQEIEYTGGGAKLKGFLAFDNAMTQKRPGILVVHEWWGHNDHARNRARMLAEQGYTALAVDVYGDGKTADHPQLAGELMNAAFQNWEGTKAKFEKAMEVLRAHKTVNPGQIAAIGYCFGGAVSLRMARGGADLAGVAAFHSALPLEPAAASGGIKAAILVANGAEDTFIKPETVADFMRDMVKANADATYLNLKGIAHSYTNPKADEYNRKFNIPNLLYSKEADERTWQAMREFFGRIFGAKN